MLALILSATPHPPPRATAQLEKHPQKVCGSVQARSWIARARTQPRLPRLRPTGARLSSRHPTAAASARKAAGPPAAGTGND